MSAVENEVWTLEHPAEKSWKDGLVSKIKVGGVTAAAVYTRIGAQSTIGNRVHTDLVEDFAGMPRARLIVKAPQLAKALMELSADAEAFLNGEAEDRGDLKRSVERADALLREVMESWS